MCWHPQGVSPDLACDGRVVHGGARCGKNGRAKAGLFANDLSAEGFGPLRWVLRNSDVVSRGALSHGAAGLSAVR